MSITEARADLSNAIDGFRSAEVAYLAARNASDAAGSDLHAAMARGESIIELNQARAISIDAASAALESLAQANVKVITGANIVIQAAAGLPMRVAVDDVGNSDVDVDAWRAARNAMVRGAASAPLPNGA
jgi:hypothetical protein